MAPEQVQPAPALHQATVLEIQKRMSDVAMEEYDFSQPEGRAKFQKVLIEQAAGAVLTSSVARRSP